MRTMFHMGFRYELGQDLPSTTAAEDLCREALNAQMDLDNPAFTGDKAARAAEKDAALDSLVNEMSDLEEQAKAAGSTVEMDFVKCSVTFRPVGSVRMAGAYKLGQIEAIISAAITAGGAVAKAYIEKRNAQQIAKIQERAAKAQEAAAREKEAAAVRAAAPPPPPPAGAAAAPEKEVAGIPTDVLAYGAAGIGAVALLAVVLT